MEGIRESNFGSYGQRVLSIALAGFMLLGATGQALAQAIPQKNVNVIGPAPPQWLYSGNPRMQQNESDGVESVVFPGHVAFGFNDYRAVNDPAISEAFPGIAMTRDGNTWISGLIPGHFADNPSLGQRGGADPNLEIAPYLMFYNFIAFSRDDSTVPGVYLSRWYEPNSEVGPPFRHLDNLTLNTGTANKFLDKPSFKSAIRNPADSLPDIEVPIPAYQDPLNPANFNDAYVLKVPALRLHLCYSVFVGNDNNDGTKIECLASDDGGVTFNIKNKLSESVEINQGTSIATRNFGKDVVVTWARFQDNNETAAVMYAMSTDYGSTFSKAKVVKEFCPFNQTTGAARFRTNALPVVVSNDDDFAVFIASRNDATETCLIPGKGNAPDTPRLSPVSLADDFDSFGEEIVDGVRTKDGMVRTSLNFSRIMMIRGNGNGTLAWGTPVAIDPQESSPGTRKRSHQFMPACDAAGGIETCSWYDSKLDKFNSLIQNLPAAPFVEDMVLHLEPGQPAGDPNAMVTPTLLPAGAYENVPDLSALPPNNNNLPLRRTIDVFAAQIQGGIVRPYTVNKDSFYATDATDPDKITSPSIRVSRFPTRQKPGAAPGVREQVEWNYANARMFQKGKSSFIGDYNAMFAQSLRKNIFGQWVSNQSAPNPAIDLFASKEPVFRAGWTSNRNVRGKVFYTGCDTWDEGLQMWIGGSGCATPYTDPDIMLPLQGEDGSNETPMTCSAANLLGKARAPLTRNQNIYTAALTPGINTSVVSAIKPADGSRSSFVLQILNGSKANRRVNLTVPPGSHVSFGADAEDSLLNIPAAVPGGSGNVRTVFDFGDENKLDPEDPGYDPDYVLTPSVIVTVTDAVTNDVLARVPLVRATLETPPLGNVQSNPDDPNNPDDPFVDLLGGEFYDLILKRQIGVDATFELENFELENTAELFDLENLDLESFDLENQLVFFELENFELENTDLKNDLYQAFDLENTVVNLNNPGEEDSLLFFDLENFELENFELENFDLENFELENFELENFDLENFDLENFELENETVFASSIENFELENFELENAVVPGDDFTEVSWTADSSSNTTTGVDVKPIFSSSLAAKLIANNSTVVLTVRRGYLNGTVGSASSMTSCSVEIVVENQVLYAAVLTPDQILQSVFLGSVIDPDPTVAETPGFFLSPDGSTVVSLRVINPGDLSFEELNANSGAALFIQSGNTVDCDLELSGGDPIDACEVDFVEPDITPPVITLNGNASVSVDQDQTYFDPGAIASDEVDGDVSSFIVVSGWDSDTSVAGDYSIFYNVMDEAGNPADTVERIVTVIDREDPAVTLVGADPLIVEAGSIFDTSDDPGATATDNVGVVGGVDSDAVLVVDTSIVGDYIVTYSATDGEGNTGTATRTIRVSDTIPPVITLLGDNPLMLEAGDDYIEPDATVADAGDLSVTIVIDSSGVDTSLVGTYSVTYNATDASTNVAIEKTRTVIVADNSVPVIGGIDPPIFTPTAPFVLAPGDTTFTIAWPVSATDPNPNLTVYCEVGSAPTQILPTVSNAGGALLYTFSYPFEVGTTSVSCFAVDQGGNTDSGSFTVTVEDIPVIDAATLPMQPFNVEANDPSGYVGPTSGLWSPITAADSIDGTIDASCTPENDLVLGANTITCIATDSAGNPSAAVTFPLTIVDTIAPTLTLLGIEPQVIEAGDPYVELGATALDIVDGDRSTAIVIDTGAVNVNAVGSYLVTYTVSDVAGNAATPITRTVNVIDTTAPTMILIGDNPQVIEGGSAYVELGATALDIVDGDRTGAIVVNASGVDLSTVGTYLVTYNVSDTTGNSAPQISRTVNVVDTTAPVISLLGANPQVVEGGNPYVELGATASDNIDTGLGASVIANASAVNTAVRGSYAVTYNVSDGAGNAATEVTRTVNVVDTTPPAISVVLNPFVISTIEASAVVTAEELKQNVTAIDIVDGSITDPAPFTCTVNGGSSATLPIGIHAGAGSCTVVDAAGNISAAAVFDIEVRFEYDFTLIIPNGNKRAGAVLPIDFYYTLPGTDTRVDASGFSIEVSWFGPFSGNNCSGTNDGTGDGNEANDAGNSKFRWAASQMLTQYSWQTPDQAGSYELVVSPPGTEQSTECVTLR